MTRRSRSFFLPFLLIPLLCAPGCTVVRVTKKPEPSMLVADGLIDGHAALGFTDEQRVLNVAVLGRSRSQGGLAEVVVWKLLRVEVGLAGLSLGVGPIHLGLGTLFYDPARPRIPVREKKPEPEKEPSTGTGKTNSEVM